MARAKYIRTKEDQIIVFSELFNHSDFKHFEPESAGFISFGLGDDRNPSCACFGRSVSLNLNSEEDLDTRLAKKQILGNQL